MLSPPQVAMGPKSTHISPGAFSPVATLGGTPAGIMTPVSKPIELPSPRQNSARGRGKPFDLDRHFKLVTAVTLDGNKIAYYAHTNE